MTDKDKTILQKIIEYIEDTYQYTHGLTFELFLKDKKTISASAFAISQIGELAKELTNEIQKANSTIPWKSIKGMRNKIVHDYKNVDYFVMWMTINNDLPELKMQLVKIINNL